MAERGDEAIAAPAHRRNILVVVFLLAQRPAQGRDVYLEVAFLDHGGGPHLAHQLLLGDDVARAFDQDAENIERAISQAQWALL